MILGACDGEEDSVLSDVECRDLSAWRVSVPRLETRTESGRACFVFIVQVQRIDVASEKDGQVILSSDWLIV